MGWQASRERLSREGVLLGTSNSALTLGEGGAGVGSGVERSYHVTFPPNPDRRHTRGRRGRGAPGFTAEDTAAFEREQAEEADAIRRAKAFKDRERELQRGAAKKRFALRGLRMRDNRKSAKAYKREAVPNRSDFREAARLANRHRVHTGTGGLPKDLSRFMIDEGMMPGAPSRRSHQAPRTQVVSWVARWKRTGHLPAITKEAFLSISKDCADKRAVAKMLVAFDARDAGPTADRPRMSAERLKLILSGDVELNPGPSSRSGYAAAQQRSHNKTMHSLNGNTAVICRHDGAFLSRAEVSTFSMGGARGSKRSTKAVCRECHTRVEIVDWHNGKFKHPTVDVLTELALGSGGAPPPPPPRL